MNHLPLFLIITSAMLMLKMTVSAERVAYQTNHLAAGEYDRVNAPSKTATKNESSDEKDSQQNERSGETNQTRKFSANHIADQEGDEASEQHRLENNRQEEHIQEHQIEEIQQEIKRIDQENNAKKLEQKRLDNSRQERKIMEERWEKDHSRE